MHFAAQLQHNTSTQLSRPWAPQLSRRPLVWRTHAHDGASARTWRCRRVFRNESRMHTPTHTHTLERKRKQRRVIWDGAPCSRTVSPQVHRRKPCWYFSRLSVWRSFPLRQSGSERSCCPIYQPYHSIGRSGCWQCVNKGQGRTPLKLSVLETVFLHANARLGTPTAIADAAAACHRTASRERL